MIISSQPSTVSHFFLIGGSCQ